MHQHYNEGARGNVYRSLNTGIVTLVNYGRLWQLIVTATFIDYFDLKKHFSHEQTLGALILSIVGNRVPPRVSQLTLAHEIGHNFGSPHDFPADCQPGLPDVSFISSSSVFDYKAKVMDLFISCQTKRLQL